MDKITESTSSNQATESRTSFQRAFRSGSIRVRLITIFVLLVLLPTIVISTFSVIANLRDGRRQVMNQLESIVSLKKGEVNSWLDTLHTDLDIELAREKARRRLLTLLKVEPGSTEHQIAYNNQVARFQQTLELTGNFEELFLLSSQGEVILSTDSKQVGKMFGRYDYFKEGLKDLFVQPPLYSISYGKTLVMISHPVRNDQGEALGVLVGRANLTRLDEIMLERSGLGETGETYLVGANKLRLTESRFGSDIDYIRTEGAQAAIDNQTNGSGDYEDYRGEPVLGVYHWLPELEVALIAEQDQSEAFQGVYRSIAGNVAAAVISLGVAVGVGLVATRRIANPLTSLTDVVAQFAEGKVEARANVESEDEIGALASSFNQMAKQIGGLLERVQSRSEELEERSRELEASQRVTFAASEHVSPDELLDLVVNLIRDQFGLYHAQVYIVDQEQNAAVLRQSTGYAGRQLLQQNHKIGLNETALVTRAIQEGEPQLVDDTAVDPNFMANPLLPDTRSELVVPLQRDDEVIGVLDVQDRESRRFSDSTVSLFQSMADQVAMLFENAELMAQITDQTERLTVFTNQLRTATQIARRLNTILDPDRLAQETVEMLQSRFGLYHAHIYLLDEDADQLNMHIGSGEVGRVLKERGHAISLEAEKSLVARAARGRHTVSIADTSLESDFMPNPLLPETRSEIAVPLIVGDSVLGVLDVQDNEANRFSEADIDTFGILAGQIATAMQTASLFEQTQTRLQVSQALAEAQTENEILDVLIEQASLYPEAQVAVMLVDPDADELTVEIARTEAFSSNLPPVPKGTRFTKETLPVLEHLSPTKNFVVNNVEADDRMDAQSRGFMDKMGIRSGANIPLAAGNNWLGELVINTRQENFFDSQRLNLYKTLADQGATALRLARLNEATAESEQRLSLMVEQSPLAVIEWNTDFEVEAWNPAAQEIFGYTEEEAMGHHAAGLIVPEEARPAVNEVWQGLLSQTGGTRSTNENFTKEGRTIMCEWYNAPIVDAKGNVLGVASLVSDITDRVEAEEAVRQERDFSDTAINSLPGIFYMYNTDGQLVRWNQNFPEVLGYSEDELAQMSVTEFIAETDRELVSSKMQQVFVEGEATVEANLQTKDGEIIPHYFTGIHAQVEGESYLVGVGIDITSRVQAEQAMRESRAQSQSLLNAIPDMMFEIDTDGVFLNFKAEQEAELVMPPEAFLNKNIHDVLPPTVSQPTMEYLEQALTSDSLMAYEYQLPNQTGKIQDYEVRMVPSGSDRVVAIVRNVTERNRTEEAIRESERRLSEAMRLADMAHWEFDVPTQTFLFNDHYYETLVDATVEEVGGYEISVEEFTQRFVPPVDRELVGKNIQEALLTDDPDFQLQMESRSLTLDGEERWISVWFRTEKDEEGNTVKLHGVNQDITDRKQAEEQIRESEQRLSLLVEQTPLAVIEWNTDFEVESWNPAAEEIFGYTEEEAMGRHSAGLIVPEEVRPIVDEVWQGLMNQAGGTRSTNENFTKNGRQIMCEWYNAPMVDAEGNVLGVASLVSDITARVEAEEARTRFTNQLRTAADLTEEISVILDPDQLLNRVVDELQSRFDLYHVHVYLTDEEQNQLVMRAGSGEVGQTMLDQGHSIPWNREQSLVARAARTQEIVSVSNTTKETGFLPNPLLPETRAEVAVPLIAGDKVLGVFDVQDRQIGRFSESDMDIFSTLAGQIAIALQNADFVEELNATAARLREVDRLKSEFLASMSHELRTPLNSIIGYTEIMLMGIDQELGAETLEDVQAIYDNSQQLLAIINDVLDLARIEAGRLEMERQEVQVADIVAAAQKSAEGLLVDDVIEFIVEAEEDLPTIQGDQRRIDQIINNLISNAIKFTEKGHVSLKAYAEDHTVCLAVEDTGVGIAEEDLDRIFERFEQLNQTVTKQRQGTGLGLAITRELVQLHGGTLEVESKLGAGSTFTVRLPVHKYEKADASDA